MASEIRVNKINSRTGVGTITLSPTGVDFTGIATVATLKATTGIVTTLTATTGIVTTLTVDTARTTTGIVTTLTADTAKVGAAVTISESGMEVTGVTTVTSSINIGSATTISSSSLEVNGVQYPTAGALSNRNLVINGAMQVAQRGTSSTSDGYLVDRINIGDSGGTRTRTQESLSSGSPYEEGFHKFVRVTNTSAGSNNASDYVFIRHTLEDQDIANSGWNYESTSSYITCSFWVRSSVSQEFYAHFNQGTDAYNYAVSIGTLAANTWTKITKTIPGNSNLSFSNDNTGGLEINIIPFWGTNFTTSGSTVDAWYAWNGASRVPDMTTTWNTTASATFDVTGLQIEVGEKATPFEHRNYGDELARCQRYFYRIGGDSVDTALGIGAVYSGTQINVHLDLPCAMRTKPSASTTGASNWLYVAQGASSQARNSTPSIGDGGDINLTTLRLFIESLSGLTTGYAVWCLVNANHSLDFSAEL